jgi:GR25 family glycosyltransferase involved in LPS biosynthesis
MTSKQKVTTNKTQKRQKSNNKIDIIYWINMDRSTERRSHMTNVLKDKIFDNIEKKRISAVDGSKANMKEYIQSKIENTDFRKRSVKEYSCALSHFNTILEFANSEYETALILEDDLSLEYKKYWTKSIQEIINAAPKDWEILQLCIILGKKHLRKKNYGLQKKLYTNKFCPSAAAYVITKKGAQRFINKTFKDGKFVLNKDHVHHADIYIFKNTNTYTYKYPLFTYTNEESTLHPKDLINDHTPSKAIIENVLKTHKESI